MSVKSRYFENPYARTDTPLPKVHLDTHSGLTKCLERLIRKYPPSKVSPFGGLYYGAASVSYLFHSLSFHYPDLIIAEKDLEYWQKAYLHLLQKYTQEFHNPRPSHCGVGDDKLTLLALEAATTTNENSLKDLCNWARTIIEDEKHNSKQASNEWLYGRAGYLYLLRLAASGFKENASITDLVNQAASVVIETILAAPRPWTWHGSSYIGGVHGTIGIIVQIVLTNPSYADRVRDDLKQVLDLQNSLNGNWPSSLESENNDRLVQFCHGATGVVHSLIRLRPYFPDLQERIDAAIETGRQCIWERGILTKEPCLCHGTTGSALTLDQPRRQVMVSYTTEDRIKRKITQKVMEPAQDGEGLWTGIAGRAWAWAVVDKGLASTFLGYDDV
ncbi:uncharacterized protein EI90DRAFT_274354 [Cantharellus anzutake]|uniref:uncharacterized protein n=1 Tax=Cantharellus anzutake TaxID=1750568 RepID=UPI0019053B54|nr:uncharacterized protein EI90DRAFT_274354 [Cantharellus anzutake]KAF8335909.1 hypothetical protein EI90DRAFT_274354 [Cantharellus anzutake]